MPRLSFDFDWVDPEGVRGPELAATWASLQIRAGDSVITRILDNRAKTVRNFIYVPLYPLAEWLAANWWFITHELQNPAKEGDPDFRRRHSLSTSREGYAFPNLDVIPSGAQTRIVWKKDKPAWTKVEFLEDGFMRMDGNEFRETCGDFIDQVIGRLDSLGVHDTFLEEEWDAIQSADEEEAEFCKAAAGLGWDPYALDDADRDHVILIGEKLGGLLDEAVPALDTTDVVAGSSAIVSAIEEAKLNKLHLERLESFQAEVNRDSTAGANPWDVGYDWARRLRSNLKLNGDLLHTTPLVADALGENAELLDKVTQPVGIFAKTPMIDGVITRDDTSPAFAFRRLRDDARRFQFCRAIAEVLASPYSDALITKAHSERQQRNRAFAAEFLAPSSVLRQRVSRPFVDDDDIDELAEEFGVSSRVIEHQIANHRIAWVGERM